MGSLFLWNSLNNGGRLLCNYISSKERVVLPPKINRVHIVGGSGSGKTTLARSLKMLLGLPTYDLDEIAYVGGAGSKRPLTVRLADIEAIVAKPYWITEGVYLWWIDALVETADLIIWLDLSWPLAIWRILVRHVKLSLTRKNRHKGLFKLLGFLRWTHYYYTTSPAVVPIGPDDDELLSRAATAQYLKPYAHKLVHCRIPTDVTLFSRAWQ